MAENQFTLSGLAEQLQKQVTYLGSRNLILVALPLPTAHHDARELASRLQADYVDFDCELLQALTDDGFDFHVKQEQRNNLDDGQAVAKHWLTIVTKRIRRDRPLVIGNVNLAVRYAIDIAAVLYDATARGLCVIAAGGRIQDQTLWVHGVQSQTSANAPTYTIVTVVRTETPPPQGTIQDRFL